jgi:competence ComEA-like helix-hairpin-helix protein
LTRFASTNWILIAGIAALLAWTAWRAVHRTVLLDTPNSETSQAGAATLPDMRIDINSATVPELSVLPAIGPGLAERIVADRQQRGPFERVESLTRVSGIGKAIIDRVKPYAVATPPPK